jgi:hypothetical protein
MSTNSTNSTTVSPLKWIQWHVYEGDNDYGDDGQTALQVNFGKGESSFLRLRFTFYNDLRYDTNAKPNPKENITLFKIVSDESEYFHAVVKVEPTKYNYIEFERIEPNMNWRQLNTMNEKYWKYEVKPWFIETTGEETLEKFPDAFKLPFPIKKEHGDKPDSWEICGVNKVDVNCKGPILFKITFECI